MTILDPEMIESLQNLGDPGFLAEVVDIYAVDAPERIETMRSAIAEGNATKLTAAAHALKSSSGNVGAARVRALCAELEAHALDGAAERLDSIEGEYAEALRALRELVASSGA